MSLPEPHDVFTIPKHVFQVPVKAMPLEAFGISVYLVHITPDIAEVWLKHKNKNRTVHLNVLGKIKRAIEQGRWEINGETIIFDANGRLIEGQHRLQAVVDTKMGIWSLVVHGIDQARFKTMGQSSKRTVGDILGILGEKNTGHLGAARRGAGCGATSMARC